MFIECFFVEILLWVKSFELLLENWYVFKFVSFIVFVDFIVGVLFKWSNNFSWFYVGEFIDLICECVKKVGGNVIGDLCCWLFWLNFDDFDFYMYEFGGEYIYYGYKCLDVMGGCFDVDMNVGSG